MAASNKEKSVLHIRMLWISLDKIRIRFNTLFVTLEKKETSTYLILGFRRIFLILRIFDYTLKLKLSIDGEIESNTRITNTATLETDQFPGLTEESTDEDIIAGAFLRERIGGSVYSEGGIRLRAGSRVAYIIGAGGDIEGHPSFETDDPFVREKYIREAHVITLTLHRMPKPQPGNSGSWEGAKRIRHWKQWPINSFRWSKPLSKRIKRICPLQRKNDCRPR